VADAPHFSLPFRFTGPPAAVTEQDSIDEITDCTLCVLLYPMGYRVELPSFGIPDPTFQTQPIDTDELRTVIEEWEPRAALVFAQAPDALDELINRVQLTVSVRSED